MTVDEFEERTNLNEFTQDQFFVVRLNTFENMTVCGQLVSIAADAVTFKASNDRCLTRVQKSDISHIDIVSSAKPLIARCWAVVGATESGQGNVFWIKEICSSYAEANSHSSFLNQKLHELEIFWHDEDPCCDVCAPSERQLGVNETLELEKAFREMFDRTFMCHYDSSHSRYEAMPVWA